MRPCFGCLKEALQAGIVVVHFLVEWRPAGEDETELAVQYASLRSRFREFKQVELAAEQLSGVWSDFGEDVLS
jgi:hypothetical protein